MPKGKKLIGCKWVFKTKRDTKGNVEKYKICLITKGFTQTEGLIIRNFLTIFHKVFFFRIIMALIAHFDLEVHLMDTKTVFLNGDIEKEIYLWSKAIIQSMAFEI